MTVRMPMPGPHVVEGGVDVLEGASVGDEPVQIEPTGLHSDTSSGMSRNELTLPSRQPINRLPWPQDGR